MNTISRIALTTAAACGLAIGGVAIASAITPGGTDHPADVAITEHNTAAPLLPPMEPETQEVFSDVVTAVGARSVAYADDSATVTFHPSAPGDITCFTVKLPGSSSESCLDAATLRTGLGHGAWQDHDGPVEVIGVVPDDVAYVEIAGETIKVQNNVWHYQGTGGDDLSFTVYSADGQRSAELK
jgi:hypothetical protein